jgi:RHS repeat-associated protein
MGPAPNMVSLFCETKEPCGEPITAIDHNMNILVALSKSLSVRTNLTLLQFLWMLVSGVLLPQRGAILPALQSTGLSEQATRRAWDVFRGGVWQTALLLRLWQEQIEGLQGWQFHCHEGYRTITVDVTAFWWPALENCPSKHYHHDANRALPAVIFGVIGKVGEIGGQRIACPPVLERVDPKDPSEVRLWRDLLLWVHRHLAPDEVAAMDAGVKLADGSGAATLDRSYQPYGKVMASAGAGVTGYGYTGEWRDSATNLIYLRARHYPPYLPISCLKDNKGLRRMSRA